MAGKLPVVAYLGPEGTYTHQAAVEHFANARVFFESKRTILDTFSAALAPESACIAFIPWENSKHGQVVDTYDALRARDVGVRARVCGEHTTAIEHCLLVRAGTRLAQVRRVLSHEQALGQCRTFLARELPEAELVHTASTARAAQAIAESTLPSAGTDAAICARICVELYQGLAVLRSGIQDESCNNTRFMVVAPGDGTLPQTLRAGGRRRGLIRVDILGGEGVRAVVGAVGLQIRLVDRRPSLEGQGQCYFVEVEAEKGCEEAEWAASVNAAAGEVKGTVLGLWEA